MTQTPFYSPQYDPAYTPFSGPSAEAAGAAVAQAGGNVVQTVAAPVLGFTRGFLGNMAPIVGIGIIAIVLLNARQKQ